MTSDAPLVLGIETSCDETGIGLVRGRSLLANAVASSVDEHARFGGVVPEVASRAHLEAMVPTIDRACREAGVRLTDVDAVAVTSGPGLAGALIVGVAAAKGLGLSLGVPVYGVNHLAAHVAVPAMLGRIAEVAALHLDDDEPASGIDDDEVEFARADGVRAAVHAATRGRGCHDCVADGGDLGLSLPPRR